VGSVERKAFQTLGRRIAPIHRSWGTDCRAFILLGVSMHIWIMAVSRCGRCKSMIASVGLLKHHRKASNRKITQQDTIRRNRAGWWFRVRLSGWRYVGTPTVRASPSATSDHHPLSRLSRMHPRSGKKRLIASFLAPGSGEGCPFYGTPIFGTHSGHGILLIVSLPAHSTATGGGVLRRYVHAAGDHFV
jgi:hypothetical protein